MQQAVTPDDRPFGVPLAELEVWKEIPGHDGYQASNAGRIRSRDRSLPFRGSLRFHRGRILRPFPAGNKQQYDYVGLGTGKKTGVHRLVALAFHGLPPSPRHEAAHWNGCPTDNYPVNLRWALPIENNRDMDRHGTRYTGIRPRGEKHHKAKLTEQDVRSIRLLCSGRRGELTEIAVRYGMDRSTISDIDRVDE